MPDEENPPEVPGPEPDSEPLKLAVENTKERIRRSRTLLHWIDELLTRRKPPQSGDPKS